MSDPGVYRPTSVPLEVADGPMDVTLVLASKTQRFVTFLIDWIGQALLAFVLTIAVFLVRPDWIERFDQLGFLGNYLFNAGFLLAYFMLLEGTTARSLGKWIMRTRVVQLDGTRPTFLQVLRRTLSRLIPFEPFSFLGSKPYGWHDTLSDTRVISLRKLDDYRRGDIEKLVAMRVQDDPVATGTEVRPAGWNEMSEAQRAIWEMQRQAERK